MPATKRLTVELPARIVEMIEARVAGGEFASADAFILARIEDEDAIDEVWEASPEYKAWLVEGDEIVKRVRAGEEPMLPLEEVFGRIEAKLEARIQAEEQAAARKRA